MTYGLGYHEPNLMMSNLDGFKLYAEDFKNLNYVVILTDLEVQAPQLISESEFVPGTYKGHVTVFDLNNGKLLNNYIVSITNSTNINFYATEGNASNAQMNAQQKLNQDYFTNIQNAITEGLAKRYNFD